MLLANASGYKGHFFPNGPYDVDLENEVVDVIQILTKQDATDYLADS